MRKRRTRVVNKGINLNPYSNSISHRRVGVSGDRYGRRDFDMTEARSEDEAFNKLFEMYELDEFSLVDGEYEVGSNELVIDSINKIDIK